MKNTRLYFGLLFAGLLRIPLKWFFAATSFLVLLVAAGMAAQAARFLVQADFLPSLASPMWDTSAFVDNGSILTASGVSAGIDLALHLVVRMHSVERARELRRYIQYDPNPPV